MSMQILDGRNLNVKLQETRAKTIARNETDRGIDMQRQRVMNP